VPNALLRSKKTAQ